jgi:hypothetical protein
LAGVSSARQFTINHDHLPPSHSCGLDRQRQHDPFGLGGSTFKIMKNKLEALIGGILVNGCIAVMFGAVIFAGCSTLQPGANPVVVRAEQLETTASAAFDLVVNTDDSNRGFWITNAPAFHNFAEWLRTPVPIPGNLNEPRGLGMILLVDQAKMTYETNSAQSNALVTAISTLQTAVDQAGAWATIVKTPTQ